MIFASPGSIPPASASRPRKIYPRTTTALGASPSCIRQFFSLFLCPPYFVQAYKIPSIYRFLKQPSSRKPPRARSARSSGTGAESTRSVSPPPPPPSLHSASAPEHPARHSRSTAATASNKVSAQTATAHANGHQHQQPGTSKEAMEAHAKSVRRRSTMNSRDAAYEANLAEALRLSKAVAGIRESSPAPDGGAAQPLAHAAATTARPAEEDETSLASATSTTPAAKIEQDLDSALAVAQDEVPKGAVETAPHGHPLHHAAEDAQAQHLQADHQHRPHQHATRSPSEAAATENGKRRRSSEDGYGHPDAGQSVAHSVSSSSCFSHAQCLSFRVNRRNKRRRSQSQTPTNEDSVRAAAVAAQAVTPEPGAVGDADGPVEVEVDAMDVDISAPAPTKKPGRGGRRGGGRGSRRGGKAAAATTPAAGGSSQLAENQVEDDRKYLYLFGFGPHYVLTLWLLPFCRRHLLQTWLEPVRGQSQADTAKQDLASQATTDSPRWCERARPQ